MLAGRAELTAWKRRAAAQMCGYVLDRFGRDGALPKWLSGLPDHDWIEACLSPFVASLVLDDSLEWSPDFAIEQSRLLLATSRSDRYPWNCPPTQLVPVLQGMGIGSRRTTCEGADIVRPSDTVWDDYSGKVRRSMELLDDVEPELLDELFTASSAVVLVDELASFRGASGIPQRGMIFLSPQADWDEVIFAEELVHETTHCMLDLMTICAPLFLNASAYAEVHRAPFRSDLRAWYGNFHAVTVCARCIGFYRRLAERRPGLQSRANERIFDLRERAAPVCVDLLRSPMDDTAKQVFDAWIAPELVTT
jgi:hypothetical protein